jgi:hypothetical protein
MNIKPFGELVPVYYWSSLLFPSPFMPNLSQFLNEWHVSPLPSGIHDVLSGNLSTFALLLIFSLGTPSHLQVSMLTSLLP